MCYVKDHLMVACTLYTLLNVVYSFNILVIFQLFNNYRKMIFIKDWKLKFLPRQITGDLTDIKLVNSI